MLPPPASPPFAPQALALGASAVLLGRPVLYGLAIGGAAGVEKVLNMLQKELELAMALSGCRCLQDIGAHLLLRKRSSGLMAVGSKSSSRHSTQPQRSKL